MRNAAGKLSHSVHFLRLRKLLLQFALLSCIKRIQHGANFTSITAWRDKETRRARRYRVFKDDVYRRDVAFAGECFLKRGAQHSAITIAHAIKKRPDLRVFALPGRKRLWHEFGESCVRAMQTPFNIK
jgi:hypothetical protein